MPASHRNIPARLVLATAIIASFAACRAYTTITPADLRTELSFTSVHAKAPMTSRCLSPR